MRKKKLMFIGIALLMVVPILSFIGVNTVDAEPSGPFAYPGPWDYEEDIVTVACAQITPVSGNPAATLEKMKDYVIQAAEQDVDIIVFGEVAFAGEETIPGPSSLEMAELAAEYDMYIVYGCVELEDGKRYDSAAIIGPEGVMGAYRKIHLGFPENFSRGTHPIAFNTPWGPVGVSICYDTYSFPEIMRTYALMGSRLFLSVNNVFAHPGLPEQMHRSVQSRVCENFIFAASVNRVSPGPYGSVGQSEIVGPGDLFYGLPTYEVVQYAGPASATSEELIVATLNLSKSDIQRNFGPFAEPCISPNPLHPEADYQPQMWSDLWGRGWRGYSDGTLLE